MFGSTLICWRYMVAEALTTGVNRHEDAPTRVEHAAFERQRSRLAKAGFRIFRFAAKRAPSARSKPR